eukprot:CAMPEP_0172584170 /NCGR_PEP_ID=MMETSP1068-20121228/3753_1 /TAXON_ID=35684 /ORGANISM="Pseudopedinella elastica, Strain CCMP716" /LENGTH=42 /DNA_ID= /DNA_START= /DNA_END= /DNA_ORIENTATION=
MSKRPLSEANIRDVRPYQPLASRLAPLSTRNTTMSKWPSSEA